MSPAVSPVLEHQIFWLLVKKGRRRDDVARVYLAIQAALAFEQEAVEVGPLLGALMPEGRRTNDGACEPIGAAGLAYFSWLFEVSLSEAGEADFHRYLFRRRADGAQILVHLRTAPFPKSLQFQQTYTRQQRDLTAKRAQFLATYR